MSATTSPSLYDAFTNGVSHYFDAYTNNKFAPQNPTTALTQVSPVSGQSVNVSTQTPAAGAAHSNTMLYVGIGVAALLVFVLLVKK